MDEIAFAMKSCFTGLYLDGFDFIQGLVLGFHLNEVKISSLLRNDFIKPTEKEITFRIRADLLSLSACYNGLGLAHNAFDQSNAMLALSGISKFSAKNITHLRYGVLKYSIFGFTEEIPSVSAAFITEILNDS